MASNILEAQAAAGQMGAALATPTASDITAGILHVERPEAKAIKVLDLTSAKELVFDFDLAACKVAVLDVDVVLMFPDGGKIILPGFAFSVVALSAHELMGPQGPIDPQHFLSLVGDTKVTDQLPTVRLTDLEVQAPKVENQTTDPTATTGVGPGEADPQPPPPPIRVVTLTPQVDTSHHKDETPVKVIVAKSENFTSYASPSPPPVHHTEDKK